MHQDYGTIIFVAIASTRLRSPPGVFASKFTVISKQEYEIQFARVGSPETQSVFRRYRQFYQLYRSIQSLGFTDPPDEPFPAKQVFRPLSASVVTHRRLHLEQWLRSAASSLFCHTFVYEFLGISGSQPLESHSQTAAELCVTDTMHRLLSEPHMKLAALENFDQRFFPQAKAVHCDFLVVFLNVLLPIVSDDHAGSRALQVLRSLISRTQFKGACEVAKLIPTLSKEGIKKARFDAHILETVFRDTREDACEIFKVIYEDLIPLGRDRISDLVRSTQLNDNSEAFAFFEAWLTRLDSLDYRPASVHESHWSVKTSPDGSEISVTVRAVGNEVELEAQMVVEAGMDRLLDVILKPDLRQLWDLRVKQCVISPTKSQTVYTLSFCVEAGGVLHPFAGVLTVAKESSSHAFVHFETEDKQFRTSYEITVRHAIYGAVNLPLSTQELPKFEDVESDDWSTPRFNGSDHGHDPDSHQCSVTIKNVGGEHSSKYFTPDLLGDDNVFLATWKKFKMVAEGELVSEPDDREETLNEALTRKSLRNVGGQKRKTGDFSDSLVISNRKLERRMFL